MKYPALAALAFLSCEVAYADETVYLSCKVHWEYRLPSASVDQSGDGLLSVTVSEQDENGAVALTIDADQVDKGSAGFKVEKPLGPRTFITKEAPSIPTTTYLDLSTEKKWMVEVFDRLMLSHLTVVIDRETGTLYYNEEPFDSVAKIGDRRRVTGTCEKGEPPKLKF
jgi:hypothetical protein